jgi:dienelactone hydrolase
MLQSHAVTTEPVRVPTTTADLNGLLAIPEHPCGAIVFAHGSGSSRHSVRNQYVAGVLNDAGFATLLFDLLTPTEEADRANVFDIALLAHRLVDATGWLTGQPGIAGLPIGFFGASTGAGAALTAATDERIDIAAVVSRGGRPDLAGPRLADVTAPTLLIVGGRDELVLELNRRAQAAMTAECRIAVIDGATHLFEEPGTLERAALLARDWFIRHLVDRTRDQRHSKTGIYDRIHRWPELM